MATSSATLTVPQTKGSFEWTVEGVSLLDANFNESIKSPEFDVSGVKCRMNLYINGCTENPAPDAKEIEDSKQHVGLYFSSQTPARCAVSLGVIVGGVSKQHWDFDARKFEANQEWGWHKFIKRTELLAWTKAHNDRATFCVLVTVVGAPAAATGPSLPVAPTLALNLKTLLDSADLR